MNSYNFKMTNLLDSIWDHDTIEIYVNASSQTMFMILGQDTQSIRTKVVGEYFQKDINYMLFIL